MKKTAKILVLLGVVLVGALAVSVLWPDSEEASALVDRATYKVERGPLLISVTESGTVQSRDQVVIKNEVEGQTAIITLAPEGQMVEEGALLVELDASQLQDQLVEQQIRVQNAEASFINARESLEVVKNQAQSDLNTTELELQFAIEDLTKYQEGDYPNELKEAEARITLAEGDLSRAQEKLVGSQRLYEKDFITSRELDADKQAAVKAELDLELAQSNLELLKEFTYKRRIAELTNAITEAEMALERAKLRASADVVQAEADLKAKEAEFKQQQDKLAKLEGQIEKTQIRAPADGLVVYATTGGGFRGNDEPLEEGQTVRERQELIYLPTPDAAMIASVKVHEAHIGKISAGLPARITVDSLPGRVFPGRVEKIAPLPDAQSAWLNPDLKVYDTEINFLETSPDVRTGMSCRVEILVERLEDALFVPIQAVVRVGGQPTAFVASNTGAVARPVEIGLDNNRMLHIIDGLEEGDEVLLAPPLAAAERGEEDEDMSGFGAAGPADAGEGPSGPGTGPGGPGAGPGGPGARGEGPGTGPGGPGAGPGGPDARSEGPGAGPGGPAAGAGAGNMDPAQMRERFENMSEEEREQMREQMRQRFENMSDEEREQMRSRGGPGGGAGPGGGGFGGGPRGGGGAPGAGGS